MIIKRRHIIRRILVLAGLLGLIAFYFCLPDPLFTDPYSIVLEDKNGALLGAKISEDGQWRFPMIDSVPKVWETAIIAYEDKRFKSHFGVDPLAIARALISNIKLGHVVSGASTLSMQVIRMSRKGKPRSIGQKIIEAIQALRLELRYSKDEILKLYASHAPFGGNVVGLEAAAWRYYYKAPALLSLSEAATLAVLPNAPGLIHPGRNRSALKKKRNKLLAQLHLEGHVDQMDYDLSLLEELPEKPYALPRLAPHYLEFVHRKTKSDSRKRSSIDGDFQRIVEEVTTSFHQSYSADGIENIACVILNTQTGKPIAYLGNASRAKQESSVDMNQAKRSSGSVLKPLLYAHMLDEGLILPKTLLLDIPTQIQGYQPRNYHRGFDGAVAADLALSRSLNVPAIHSLKEYGVPRFLDRLRDHQFTTFNNNADYYGLSLILGGGEVTLYELAKVYAHLGGILLMEKEEDVLSPGAIYLAFEAMQKVSRPDEEGQWEQFSSSRKMAWKTGTSYGHRDAWAVGVTPEYTIAVWVGNADGEGRNGLVGVKKAGPVLFDVLNRLPETTWFDLPADHLETVITCTKSGHLLGQHCTAPDTSLLPMKYQETRPCPYHKKVFLDKEGYLANNDCTPTYEMEAKTYFVLPPNQSYYYRTKDPDFNPIPSSNPKCQSSSLEQDHLPLAFIYPTEAIDILLPIDMDGKQEKVIFKASHNDPKSSIHWHLDDKYLGVTEDGFHTMDIVADQGKHKILIIDQYGNEQVQLFNVIR